MTCTVMPRTVPLPATALPTVTNPQQLPTSGNPPALKMFAPRSLPEPGEDPSPPVSGLPVEILTNVFTYLIEHPGGLSTESPHRLAHVCRHWQAVATAFKPLWASVSDNSQLDWIKLKLERSDPVPLSAWVFRGHDADIAYYEKARLVLGELPRIQEMHFTVNRLYRASGSIEDHAQGRREMVDLLNASPAPVLQYLDITMGDDASGNSPLSPSIFTGITPPNLRRLELTDCTVPEGYHLLTAALTHLELSNCAGWDTMDELMDMLERLPLLKMFVYSADSESPQIREVESRRENHSVGLPRLILLKLHEDIVAVAHILRLLALLSNTNVIIETEDEDASELSPQEIAGLFQPGLQTWLASAFAAGGGFSMCAIEMPGYEDLGFTMKATRLLDADDLDDATPPRPLRFDFSMQNFTMDTPDLCNALLEMLTQLPGMTNPTAVVAKHTRLLDTAASWRKITGDWDKVEMLALEERTVYGFIGALNDETKVLFPHLKIVAIRAADLNVRRRFVGDGSAGEEVEAPDAKPVDTLATALVRRAGLGCPPFAIVIRECDVSVENMQVVKDAIGPQWPQSLIWDQKVDAVSRQEEQYQFEMQATRSMIAANPPD
ncbi:hypothetical protein OF83DRAFT_1082278 [Amylostereum chailletii]|nr:hypothetical protein OF83DRAFT_1082278 [Amylostereum chailletii]